jgi:hypothetical protein
MKCIAVARNNIFGLVHLLLEDRIVRCELVGAVGRLDQEEAFAIAGAQVIDHRFTAPREVRGGKSRRPRRASAAGQTMNRIEWFAGACRD